MPTVPYSAQGRRVALEPLGAPRALGVSLSPALVIAGRGLQELSQVAEKFQLEHDITAAKSVETDFRGALLEAGTGNGGFYTLAGENAIRAQAGYAKTVEKLYQQAKGALGAGRVARLAGESLDTAYLTERARSIQHYRKELSTWQDERSVARSELAAAEAVAFYNDRELFKKSLDTIAHEALERGQRAGASEEVIAADVLGLQSKAIQASITSAAARDPSDALELFAKWGNRLDAGTRAAVSNTVFDAARKVSAIEISERLLSGGGSQQQQLAEVREIEDPELRDSVRVRVNQFWTDQRVGRESAMRDLDASLTRIVLSGEINTPEDLLLHGRGASGSTLRALDSFIAKRADGSTQAANDPAASQRWRLMTDEQLAQQEPNGVWLLDLGRKEFEEDFIPAVGAARRALATKSAPKQITRPDIEKQITDWSISIGIGVPHEDRDEDENTRSLGFANYVREGIRAYEDPTWDDLQVVLQRATRRHTVIERDFWTTEDERFGFELTPEQIGDVQMSEQDRAEARAHLVGQGVAPTDEAIDALFRDFLRATAAGGR